MFNLSLFLGFPINPAFETATEKTNPYLLTLLRSGGNYLEEIVYEEKRYLGKFTPAFPTVDQLDSLESHILSLLKKLAPEYNFEVNSLVLFSLHERNHCPT